MKNNTLVQGGQNFDSEFWIHLRISNKEELSDHLKWSAEIDVIAGQGEEEK